MKKSEKNIVIGLLIVALLLFGGWKLYTSLMDNDKIVVLYRDKEVFRCSPDKDSKTLIHGSYGTLYLEVKDGKWRVTEEQCPNHICSSIGWVSVDDYFPIICLPNEVVVELRQ